MTIKNWEDTDKPREKMMAQGKTALSNAELLAILLGSGSADESAVELSRRILASVNNSLTALGKQSLQQLQAFKGIGQAKAITILAATEMGRRRAAETPEPQPKIEVAHNVFTLMQPLIGELPHEEFWVLYLNSTNRMIHQSTTFFRRDYPDYRRRATALQNSVGARSYCVDISAQPPFG
ncbi:DNA repair protein RadC [Capnocytophaga ochracea]|uniref:DNA repair protein RadC n=1 Tax=Capnocytophaga ochracea TaxID=1018 RepID=A0A2X2UY58_CAPOC|nr:DNA repair protein RadC [Capnocytophaga ochracea]